MSFLRTRFGRRRSPAVLLGALALLACALTLAADARTQPARTAEEVQKDIALTERIQAAQRAEAANIKQQRDRALGALSATGGQRKFRIRGSPQNPMGSQGWNDFSVSPDMNADPGSALVFYSEQLELAEGAVKEGELELSSLRRELEAVTKGAPGSSTDPSSEPAAGGLAYSGAVTGGAPGGLRFTISGGWVSGTVRGAVGTATVDAKFSGPFTQTDSAPSGTFQAELSGTIDDPATGNDPFVGTLGGTVSGARASGRWSATGTNCPLDICSKRSGSWSTSP